MMNRQRPMLHYLVISAVFIFASSLQPPILDAAEPVEQNPSEAALFKAADSSGASAEELSKRFLVVIDPGHGGVDTGAKHRHKAVVVAEKDLTLSLARELARKLRTAEIPVILTRSADETVSLDMRAAIANRARATLFISIHVNSSRSEKDSGVETYVLNATTNEASQRLAVIENGRGHHISTLSMILSDLETTANHSPSVDFACATQKSVVAQLDAAGLKAKDRGVKQALFYILMQTHMPSILFETGFSSNPLELSRLTKPKYRDRLTTALAQGIVTYKQQWSRAESSAGNRLSGVSKQTRGWGLRGQRCRAVQLE